MRTTEPKERAALHGDLARFSRSLGAMLAADVELRRAVEVASRQTGNAEVLEAAILLRADLAEGQSFTSALARHPHLFSPFYIQMVRQGEEEDVLGATLLAVAEYLESRPRRELQFVTGIPVRLITLPMITLGIVALGAAVIWLAATANLLPIQWTMPLALIWAGACLLTGAWLLTRVRHAAHLRLTTHEETSFSRRAVRGRDPSAVSSIESQLSQSRPDR